MMYVINDTDNTFIVGSMKLLPETCQPFDETSDAYQKFFADNVIQTFVAKKRIYTATNQPDADLNRFMRFRDAQGNKLPSYGVCQVCGSATDLWTGRCVNTGEVQHVFVDNIAYVSPGILAMTTEHSTYENGTWLIGG